MNAVQRVLAELQQKLPTIEQKVQKSECQRETEESKAFVKKQALRESKETRVISERKESKASVEKKGMKGDNGNKGEKSD